MKKPVASLLMLCVAFAVLRMAVVALVVGLGLALLVSLIKRPRETISFLGTFALVILANAHPLACIITLGVISVAVVVQKTRRPLLLTDGSEHHPPEPGRLDRDLLG